MWRELQRLGGILDHLWGVFGVHDCCKVVSGVQKTEAGGLEGKGAQAKVNKYAQAAFERTESVFVLRSQGLSI